MCFIDSSNVQLIQHNNFQLINLKFLSFMRSDVQILLHDYFNVFQDVLHYSILTKRYLCEMALGQQYAFV